jgi:FixJ family two-component response regulator
VNCPVGREQTPITPPENSLLSVRRREMFEQIVAAQSNKEIARNLGLSESTVEIHIAKLCHRSAVALVGSKIRFFPRN